MSVVNELKKMLETREDKERKKIAREESQRKAEEKKKPSPKKLADDFTEEAVKTIEKAIKKGETTWGFKGEKQYLEELKKNLEKKGFTTITMNHDRGFEASDPDGGWLDYAPFDFIVVHFEHSWQIK